MKLIFWSLLFAGLCAGGKVKDKPLNILLGTTRLPPYDETAPASVLAAFNAAVLGQLLTIDTQFDVQPGLIVAWRFDFQEMKYILTLAPNIYFHNGRKATAADLEFALLRGFFTKHKSFYNIFLGNIYGLEEIKEGANFKSGLVKGIKILNESSIEVRLKEPNPSFLFSLVNPYFSLVPIEALKDNYIEWKDMPIGAGPYKVVNGYNEGKVELQYIGKGTSASPRVNLYTELQDNVSYDVSLIDDPFNKKLNYEAELSRFPLAIWQISFHNVHALGADVNFRKAVHHALNRADILSGFPEMSSSYELLPHHFWGRLGLSDPYDLQEAKKFIAKVPKKFLVQELKVPVFAGKTFTQSQMTRLERIKKNLSEIGVRVSFYPTQDKFTSKEQAIESPMKLSGKVADLVDPLIVFSAYRESSPYLYDRPILKEQFEDHFKKAAKVIGKEERVDSIRKLSEFVSSESIVVPIAEQKSIIYFNKDTIKALGYQPQAFTLLVHNIQTK